MNKPVNYVNYKGLTGLVCLSNNKPLLYLTLYTSTHMATLAESTQYKNVSDINRFYDFCVDVCNEDLDRLLANGEFEKITQVLEQFYISLLNDQDMSYRRVTLVWDAVRKFVDTTSKRLLPSIKDTQNLNWGEIQHKYEYMRSVYMQLKSPKNRSEKLVLRALSPEAISNIFNIIQARVRK